MTHSNESICQLTETVNTLATVMAKNESRYLSIERAFRWVAITFLCLIMMIFYMGFNMMTKVQAQVEPVTQNASSWFPAWLKESIEQMATAQTKMATAQTEMATAQTKIATIMTNMTAPESPFALLLTRMNNMMAPDSPLSVLILEMNDMFARMGTDSQLMRNYLKMFHSGTFSAKEIAILQKLMTGVQLFTEDKKEWTDKELTSLLNKLGISDPTGDKFERLSTTVQKMANKMAKQADQGLGMGMFLMSMNSAMQQQKASLEEAIRCQSKGKTSSKDPSCEALSSIQQQLDPLESLASMFVLAHRVRLDSDDLRIRSERGAGSGLINSDISHALKLIHQVLAAVPSMANDMHDMNLKMGVMTHDINSSMGRMGRMMRPFPGGWGW